MSRIEKLLKKARENPKGLRFRELCSICEAIGMEARQPGGSHIPYKRSKPPRRTITIQDYKGMAKDYQVKQVLNFIDEYGLLEREE